MTGDDRIRLQHMYDAAKKVTQAIQGRTRRDLDDDQIWMLGLVKCIEIIGEAAANVSLEIRNRHPQIPWKQIVAMRHRLVHVYFDLNLDVLWKAIIEDLPPLMAELEKISEEPLRT